jgi:enediyne biosynthesis protein E4
VNSKNTTNAKKSSDDPQMNADGHRWEAAFIHLRPSASSADLSLGAFLRVLCVLVVQLTVSAFGICGCRSSGAVARAPERFVDVTAASGLGSFIHTDGSSGRRFFVEQIGSGCAFLDYDNDGWQDVYLCNGAPLPGYQGPRPRNALFHNDRDGRFTDVTGAAGVGCGHYAIGCAAGDYDNDGFLDLYVCCYGPNVLYHNNGDGTFTDVTRRAGVADPRLSSSAAWGDYDGDGFLDLYVANYVRWRLDRDRWCSKFPGHNSYCGPTLYPPEVDTLYHNNGYGTFTDVSDSSGIRAKAANGLAVLWCDANEDGRPDIVVADDQTPNLLWRNDGGGHFTDVATEAGVAFGELGNAQAGMGVDAGDYDNDGRVDLVVTNFSEEANSLFHNERGAGERSGRFRDVSFPAGIGSATLLYLGFGTGFLDYDRDGWLDLFFANGHVMDDIEKYSDVVTWAQPNQLFRNRGAATPGARFEDVSAATGIGGRRAVSRGAAFGDFNNDGRPDILVSTLRGAPLLLRNDCAPSAHWLRLRLRAAWGNPHAIGASVTLTAGGLTQRRDVRSGGSYASSSDLRPLFGLGAATRVDRLRVRWPSGQETELQGVAADREVVLEEPRRKAAASPVRYGS